jgi:uncharacterized protein (PEP-CTERM system associated)
MANITVDSHAILFKFRTFHSGVFFTISLLILISLNSFNANAADWKFVPTVNLTETHTDNVRLLPGDKAESAYITQVSPGIAITANGQRLKVKADYVMENSYYSGITSETRTNHLLHANTNFTFLENLLFWDGKASITQQYLTPFGQVSDNNFNLLQNRVEVRTYSATPYLRHNFDNKFTGELLYSYDSVVSSQTSIRNLNQNSVSDNVRFSLNSGSAFRATNWGLNYSTQIIHFKRQAPIETEMFTLSAGYPITNLFRATATVGNEKNNYVTLGERPPGSFGTVGFSWSPSQRTSLVYNAGQRFYGKTHSLSFSHRARMSIWNLGYNEDVTTTRGQYLIPSTSNTSAFLNQLWTTAIPDSALRQQKVDNFIRDSGLPAALAQPINTTTNQVFLQRGLQGSFGLTGVQNTAIFSLFNNLREPLSTGGVDAILNPSVLNKIRQTGANFVWNTQFSPRTNANFSAGYNKADTLGTTLIDKTKSLRASISRQLQQKIKASLEVRRLQRDSTLVNGNYEENAVTLYLYLGF